MAILQRLGATTVAWDFGYISVVGVFGSFGGDCHITTHTTARTVGELHFKVGHRKQHFFIVGQTGPFWDETIALREGVE